MRIAVAGASGFLGAGLVRRLGADGYDVVRLVRRPARGSGEVSWRPQARELDPGALATVDAVVNLAGAPVAPRRWTHGYKAVIRSSRVDATATLASTVAGLPLADRPRALLNASGVHWYGDTGDRAVEEGGPAGDGFLSGVCQDWEAATAPAADAGVRVVALRTGLPLDRAGGFLRPQLLPFRLGLGGRLGSGRQWLPWIAYADWLDAVEFLLAHEDVAGPVNLVGPAPATNADFTKALGRALHRPAVLPVPAFALRIALGEFAQAATDSLRVLPGALTSAGFTFRHPTLDTALRAALA